MDKRKMVADALALAYGEIENHGLPTKIHFDISLRKGEELAARQGADAALVAIGIAMMDIALGRAFKSGRLAEHVAMGVAVAREFLVEAQADEDTTRIVINCIEAHHGAVPFVAIESEIVTNADCYRFLHPAGVLHYCQTLTKRGLSEQEMVKQALSKLQEKKALLSMAEARAELLPYVEGFEREYEAALQFWTAL